MRFVRLCGYKAPSISDAIAMGPSRSSEEDWSDTEGYGQIGNRTERILVHHLGRRDTKNSETKKFDGC